MNLFLVGHGFVDETKPVFKIPSGITLKFYCRSGTEFDSTWEGAIVDSLVKGPALAADYKPKQGSGQWELTTFSEGQDCSDHLLTRPGGMKTVTSLSDMKEIKVPNEGQPIAIDSPLPDNGTLCIKGGAKIMGAGILPGRPYAYLSDILLAIKKATDEATVHWCACRSEFSEEDMPEVDGQARSAYGGVLQTSKA